MKRAAITYCAGMDPARFDQLMKRDQLPFFDGSGGNTYTLKDAFRLRLFMLAAEGTDLDSAAYLAGEALHQLFPINPMAWTGGVDVFVALVRYEWADAPEGWICRKIIAGRWGDLEGKAEAWVSDLDPSAKVTSIFALSASNIGAHVWKAARDLGIPEGDTVPSIPEDLTGYPEWFKEAEMRRREMLEGWGNPEWGRE